MNVVIVEDARDVARLEELLLTDAGHTVTVYTEGFDRLLHPEPWQGVDVALLDLMLGEDTSGADILGYLANHHPHIRRVVCSAVSDVLAPSTTLADVVLRKPAGVTEILAAVDGT